MAADQSAPSGRPDWEAIEREYRGGQLSLREIGRLYNVSDTAIRKKAKAEGWERDLTEKVRQSVRAKLVRDVGSQDGSQPGSQGQRADNPESDRAAVEAFALRGVEVVRSHRKSLSQLNALADILADRLAQHLDGIVPDGPAKGEKESPADMLEKLTRIKTKVIQLERQAFNLGDDDDGDDHSAKPVTRIERIVVDPSNRDASGVPAAAEAGSV